VQLSQKYKNFPFGIKIFESFKIGKFNLPIQKNKFLGRQNRQKCAQKQLIAGAF